MKNMFCSQLNNVISFFPERIMSCCTSIVGPVYFENIESNKDIDYMIFKELKKVAFNQLNSSDSLCKNCFFLKEKTENDVYTDLYNELNISHWMHCNCNCIYCLRERKKADNVRFFKKNSRHYNLLPIIKGLYDNNLLDVDNLLVRFQGGDISVLKEFEPLVREFDKRGVSEFIFLSNNIIYQPIISEMFKKRKSLLLTSLDCGSRETYKKIKRVDKFENMINNLKRYKKECGDKARLNVKYIVIPEYNDNEKEVKLFLQLMNKLEIPIINFEIDYRYINSGLTHYYKIPKHFYDLFDLFQDYSTKNNVELDICEYTRNILKKGYYEFNCSK